MALLQALRTGLRLQAAPGLQLPHASGACFQLLRGFAAAPNQMALIKELRERTGAPITDVKAALKAAEWDLGGGDDFMHCACVAGCPSYTLSYIRLTAS